MPTIHRSRISNGQTILASKRRRKPQRRLLKPLHNESEFRRQINVVTRFPLRRPSGGFLSLTELLLNHQLPSPHIGKQAPHRNVIWSSHLHQTQLTKTDTPSTTRDQTPSGRATSSTRTSGSHQLTQLFSPDPSFQPVQQQSPSSGKSIEREAQRDCANEQEVGFLLGSAVKVDNARCKFCNYSNPYSIENLYRMTSMMSDQLRIRNSNTLVQILRLTCDIDVSSLLKNKEYRSRKIVRCGKQRVRSFNVLDLSPFLPSNLEPSLPLDGYLILTNQVLGVGGVSHVFATPNPELVVKVQVGCTLNNSILRAY